MLPLSKPSRTNISPVVVADGAVSVFATAEVVATAVDTVAVEATVVAVTAEVGSAVAAVEPVDPVDPATPQAPTTTSSNKPAE
jgi:hypothetical protein